MALIVVMTVDAADAELAADRLWQLGAMAVEERESGVLVELRAALGDDPAEIVAQDWPSGWLVSTELVDDRLADGWRPYADASDLGGGWAIIPAWKPELGARFERCVLIEPGSTFGMGDHPTTRLSARALLAAEPAGRSVLDVGTGSGVLAIVASMAGASSVLGLDITNAVITVGPANAARNGVTTVRFDTTPLSQCEGQWDVVVANILAPTLVALADDLRRSMQSDGCLIVSGLLADHYGHVVDALTPLRVTSRLDENGWVALTLRR